MAWSGQFSDFDSFTRQNDKRNINTSNARSINANDNKDKTNMKLENINLGYSSIVNVVGLILSREDERSVQSRKNSSTERFVFNFTLRDSPLFYVNVTFWGKEQNIKDLTDRFHIGDVVCLSNVQVQAKPQDGSDEKYKSATPVPFCLSGSENHSNIEWYNGPESDTLLQLQHVPIKATNDFYTLEDIQANGQGLHGEHVNLLCVVRKVGQVKEITTKAGRHTQRCELRILDETCPSFALVLWDKELIDLALTWVPLETVIFAADVKVTYDDFRSTMIATADSKTIVTVNPDTLEAQSLYQFAHSQDFQDGDQSSGSKTDPSLDSITDVYNISQIKQIMEDLSKEWKPTQYGIVYVFLTMFNIDTEGGGVLRFRCEKCRETVYEDRGYLCSNVECTQGALAMFDTSVIDKQPVVEYSVPVSISDHTGTIEHCFIDGTVMENLLGIKAEVFRDLNIDKRTQMKWNFLLERCKLYFKIFKSSSGGTENKSVFRIMSLKPAKVQDCVQNFIREM
ncbi:meiosis-specific with OB domain-containing protein-like isoform X1 [Mytilus galloprovincialis]|uniref:meiosis-specific with OB domain-containing protein-like isoform X1 n=1 Tax=Mytilus galloprovincialis TaxID=29158 RepID=UPI003F7B75BF